MKITELTKQEKQEGFHSNIENDTLENTDYRRVLYTTDKNQLVLMNLRPGEEIGAEVHDTTAQFIRIESGVGKAVIGGNEYHLEDGSAVIVPAGVEHNIINVSDSEDLKLYTVYSPGDHKPDTVQATKADEKEGE